MVADDQGSRQSTTDGYNEGNQAPYLRLVKTQLNFFMTRMLFMQEAQADSLGAQKARMQNSASSLNNSASRDMSLQAAAASGTVTGGGDGLKGYFDEGHVEAEDELWVYNDNARVLPNARAKSYPPIPSPPAAPESPRPVERKDGVRVMTPTHQPTDPMARKPAAVDLTPLTLEDGDEATAEGDNYNPMDLEDIPPVAAAASADEYSEGEGFDEEEDMEDFASVGEATNSGDEGKARKAISPFPRGSRVFPKNQRRSGRFSSKERPQRSQSFSKHNESSGDEDSTAPNLNSSSLH